MREIIDHEMVDCETEMRYSLIYHLPTYNLPSTIFQSHLFIFQNRSRQVCHLKINLWHPTVLFYFMIRWDGWYEMVNCETNKNEIEMIRELSYHLNISFYHLILPILSNNNKNQPKNRDSKVRTGPMVKFGTGERNVNFLSPKD